MTPSLASLFPEVIHCGADGAYDEALLPATGGVYALADENDRVVQLSSTQRLRQAVQMRLAPVAEVRPGRPALREITRRIYWIPVGSQFAGTWQFLEASYQLYPQTYRKLCAFGPAYFAVIDMSEPFPRWRAAQDPEAGPTACIGPFQRRRTCEALIQGLEDLFALCRDYTILEQAPRGQACAYAEMGRCPAPCDGSIPLTRYQSMLAASIEWVRARDRGLVERLQADMTAAAADLAFERAGRLKQDAETAEKLVKQLYFMVTRVEDLQYLVVQRDGLRKRVLPFFVDRGSIHAEPSVASRHIDEHVPLWLDKMAQLPACPPDDPRLARERLWLVSYFANKSPTGRGLVWLKTKLPTAEEIVEQVRETFRLKKK